jgi:hypothetical protein
MTVEARQAPVILLILNSKKVLFPLMLFYLFQLIDLFVVQYWSEKAAMSIIMR